MKEEIRVLRKSNEEFENHARRELQALPKDVMISVKKLQTDLNLLRQDFTNETKLLHEFVERTHSQISQLDQQIASINKHIGGILEEIGTDRMHFTDR